MKKFLIIFISYNDVSLKLVLKTCPPVIKRDALNNTLIIVVNITFSPKLLFIFSILVINMYNYQQLIEFRLLSGFLKVGQLIICAPLSMPVLVKNSLVISGPVNLKVCLKSLIHASKEILLFF